MTTLQREILRFVAIVGGCAIAVAILIVILWAAWYVECDKYLISNFTRETGFVVLSQEPLTYPLS